MAEQLDTEARYVTVDDVAVATTLAELDVDRLVTGRPVRAVRSQSGQRHR